MEVVQGRKAPSPCRPHAIGDNLGGGATGDQRSDLDRQVARITEWATALAMAVSEEVIEVGSGMNGRRRKLSRLLTDATPEVCLTSR